MSAGDSPAEAARREVEELVDELSLALPSPLNANVRAHLIARLTPTFTKAQAFDQPVEKSEWQALRERAERAERSERNLRDALSAQNEVLQSVGARAIRAEAKLADATAYCSGEFPCEASTSAASLEWRLNNAEADVQRLREAVEKLGSQRQFGNCWCRTVAGTYCVGQPQCVRAKAALAATEGRRG